MLRRTQCSGIFAKWFYLLHLLAAGVWFFSYLLWESSRAPEVILTVLGGWEAGTPLLLTESSTLSSNNSINSVETFLPSHWLPQWFPHTSPQSQRPALPSFTCLPRPLQGPWFDCALPSYDPRGAVDSSVYLDV